MSTCLDQHDGSAFPSIHLEVVGTRPATALATKLPSRAISAAKDSVARPATTGAARRRQWSKEPVAVLMAGRVSYPIGDPRRPTEQSTSDHSTLDAPRGVSAQGPMHPNQEEDEAGHWRECCYDRETGKLAWHAPANQHIAEYTEARLTEARYVRCYYNATSGATRWTKPIRCWYDPKRDMTRWRRDECPSPSKAVACWYENGRIQYDGQQQQQRDQLELYRLLDADKLEAASAHPALPATARRAWRDTQGYAPSYVAALRRAAERLDIENRDPAAVCRSLRAILAPALDDEKPLAKDDERASVILAVVRGLLPLAVDDDSSSTETRQAARLALAPALVLAGKAAGPTSVRACANEYTARALLAVFDHIAARALAILLRAWRKQRLATMPLSDILDAALNGAQAQPPHSKHTASYLALAAAVLSSAPHDKNRRQQDDGSHLALDPAHAECIMATVDRVLNLGDTDPNTDRRAVAQARLLLDLLDFR